MKALFLVFHGFEAYNGISKKIFNQVDGLKQCGIDIKLSYLNIENHVHYRMVDDLEIENYGKNIFGKIKKRICYKSLLKYVETEKIELIYIRYVHNANPFLINFLKSVKRLRIKIVMEIPTFPYDHEYKGLPLSFQINLLFDKCFRLRLIKYIDRIVTFSDHKQIWGCPTIQISNGINFSQIKLKKENLYSTQLNLIGVASIRRWHGYDRLINGLIDYYKQANPPVLIYFHIIGEGICEIINDLKKLTNANGLDKYIIFYGPKYGNELDDLFELANIGVGSLARHRSSITNIKTLKNREYAARGLPFIYSEFDDDFENKPYIYKVPADESPIDINKIIEFYKNFNIDPKSIRVSIEDSLSWKVQMHKLINQIYNDFNNI